jgi:high-affinity nickel-transport protein
VKIMSRPEMVTQTPCVDDETGIRSPWWPYGLSVGVLHALGVSLLIAGAYRNPALMGIGMLAYTLGLRHAFDADHIASIDNTVRKLVQQRENPAGVGFYFSLGHSTVVTLTILAATLTAQWLVGQISSFKEIGGLIGTLVSGIFLLLIALLNLLVWLDIWRLFWALRRGKYHPEALEVLLTKRGMMARFIKPLWKFVNKSWHAYFIGLLFGLGFDTASQVTLLAFSTQTGVPLSWPGVIALPLLFAAGMSLMDTADGVFMTRAYGWAFSTPLRKLYYNLTVTGLSVLAAWIIGGIELLQVLGEQFEWQGRFWDWLRNLELSGFGYLLIGLFVFTWAVSYGVWKVGRLEERWENAR